MFQFNYMLILENACHYIFLQLWNIFLLMKRQKRWIHFATQCVQSIFGMINVWEYALIEGSIMDIVVDNRMALIANISSSNSLFFFQ